MRIVLFIGSPLEAEEGEVVKLAKRLKKEKVNVDIVSFGEHQKNSDILTTFINALNGKDGTGSHLVSVPRGSQLQDALISSPIIQGEMVEDYIYGFCADFIDRFQAKMAWEELDLAVQDLNSVSILTKIPNWLWQDNMITSTSSHRD